MVTRKPVPSTSSAVLTPVSSPPVAPQPFTMQDVRDELRSTDSEPDGASIWSQEVTDNLAAHEAGQNDGMPALRAGPLAYTSHGSQEMLRPAAPTTNPYLQKNNAQGGGSSEARESSATAWGAFADRPPTSVPPPPVAPKGMLPFSARASGYMLTYTDSLPPLEQFPNLTLSEPSKNPWQPALNEKASSEKQSPRPSPHRQDSGNDAWAAPPSDRQPPTLPDQQPVLVDVDEAESPAWDEDEPESPVPQEMPAENPLESQQLSQDRHAWEEDQGQVRNQNAGATSPFLVPEDPTQQGEGWNIVDRKDPGQQSGVIGADGMVLERFPTEGIHLHSLHESHKSNNIMEL